MRGLTDIDIAILTDALLPTPTREEIEEFGIDTFPEHDELKCRAAERLLREDRIVVALDLGNGDRWFNVTHKGRAALDLQKALEFVGIRK